MRIKLLSKQETRIAHLIANEYLEKEIADKLCISVHTVHTHTKSIRKKLKVKNIAGITREYMFGVFKSGDFLKAVLFLLLQFYIVFDANSMDIRRPNKLRSRARIVRLKTK